MKTQHNFDETFFFMKEFANRQSECLRAIYLYLQVNGVMNKITTHNQAERLEAIVNRVDVALTEFDQAIANGTVNTEHFELISHLFDLNIVELAYLAGEHHKKEWAKQGWLI